MLATVRDIMHSEIVSVAPNALIEHALDLMIEFKISGLPVVDDEGTLVGVISEFDALALMCDESHEYWPVEPVVGLMSTHVESVSPDMLVTDLAHRFHDGNIRRFPVVEAGRLVGIVSRRDAVKALRDERRTFASLPLSLTRHHSSPTPKV
jgi:CBS domain-containing protein